MAKQQLQEHTGNPGSARRQMSPLVGVLSKRYAIDPTSIHGSGSGGRVAARDIRRYVAANRDRFSPRRRGGKSSRVRTLETTVRPSLPNAGTNPSSIRLNTVESAHCVLHYSCGRVSLNRWLEVVQAAISCEYVNGIPGQWSGLHMAGNDEEGLPSIETEAEPRRIAVHVQTRPSRVVLHSGARLRPGEDRLVIGFPSRCLVPLSDEQWGIGVQLATQLTLDYDASAVPPEQAEALLEAIADHLTESANLPA